jgi:uncharacterized membrane protein YhhN
MLLPKERTAAYYGLLGLFLLWAALLFGGFALGTGDDRGQRIPTAARMGSSLVLVAAAWTWYGHARPRGAGGYALLIALGMTFGFVGDLFMAGLLPAGDPVLGGMASFGVGHLFYLAAMFRSGRRPALAAWLAWLLIGVAGWYAIVGRADQPVQLRAAALGYVLLLASTAGCASGLALRASAFWPLAVGAALFFVSDLLIALESFGGGRFPLIGSAIWLTYGPAQALIVGSTTGALSVLGGAPAQAVTLPALAVGDNITQ